MTERKETMTDEFDGQGGSYVIQDGKRVRVEQTNDHPEGNRPRDAEGRPLDVPTDAPSEAPSRPADTALAQPSEAGGGAKGRSPRERDSNVSALRKPTDEQRS